MDKAKKDTIFQVAGIIGLAILLSFVLWSGQHGDTNSSSPERSEADHETTTDYDHSEPSQQIEREALQPGDVAVKPSGKVEDGVRLVTYEAFRYGYDPDPLVVRAGEKVKLKFKSRDVDHGMIIPEVGLNANIQFGKIKEVEFTAPGKPGKYPISCSVFCGSGHGSMRGSLVVLPNEDSHEDNR